MGSPLARDLVAYKLLELNNVDSVEFLETAPLKKLITDFNLQKCTENLDITICSKADNNVAISFIPLKIGDNLEGYLKLDKSLKLMEEINKKVLFTIGITVLVVFLINVFTLVMIWWKFLKPETFIESEKEDPTILIKEYKKIQDSFLEVISKVKTAESEKSQLVSQLQKMSLATQVAHDIRSPLEVLKGLKDEMENFPAASKKRILLSIHRIEEITFNLLKTHKESYGITDDFKSEKLLSLTISVLTEKNIEYKNLIDTDIVGLFNSSSYGLFSVIQRNTLKSILSNLINNGVESLNGGPGVITVSLIADDNSNIIKVTDNGPGITQHQKSKIFTKGFTSKNNGNGLGIFNAKLEIEAVGGSLVFTTVVGEGTTFIITLPKSEKTPSFPEAIHAYKYDKIIILDDDHAFHEIWNKRLEGLENKIDHIYSVDELFFKYQLLNSKILLLSDFELMDRQYDGIDAILKLAHAEHSILVTARNEEQAIQERCLKSEIKLLSKSLVNYVKVLSSPKENSSTSIVLIDDDRLIHVNWSLYCKKHGLPFLSFMSVNDFIIASTTVDKTAMIFIDSNLGKGIKGEIESENIFKLGFLNLFLTTGYEKNTVIKPAWIKEIYSKSPENIKS